MIQSNKDRLKELRKCFDKEFPISHYYCEDCWYSCPLAEEGCCDEEAGDECNCGAVEKHEEIWKFIVKNFKPKEKK